MPKKAGKPGKKTGKKKMTQAERRRLTAEKHREEKLRQLNEEINIVLGMVTDDPAIRPRAQNLLKAKLRQEKKFLKIWLGEKVPNMTAQEKMTAKRAEEERRRESEFSKVAPKFHKDAIEAYEAALKRLKFKVIE